MAEFVVRQIEGEGVKERLAGCVPVGCWSMEEEVRQILRNAAKEDHSPIARNSVLGSARAFEKWGFPRTFPSCADSVSRLWFGQLLFWIQTALQLV